MLTFLLSISEESDHDKIVYLYNSFHDDMLGLAKSRLRTAGMANYETDAEDVVQNAFVKITKYIGRINFEMSEREIKSYVLSIVANETTNIMNDHVFFEDLDNHVETVSEESFVKELLIRERYQEVMSAIEAMDEKYRTALLFRYGMEYEVKQMAELFEIPEKTVYTRIERGQKLLLQMLKEGEKA